MIIVSTNFDKNPPIFIIGNPRSGTTLFRLMLSAHPNIYIAQECGFLEYFYDKYKNFDGQKKIIDNFIEDVLNSKKIEFWNLDKNGLKEFIYNKSPNSYKELAASVYEYYGKKNYPNKSRWGDKNNYYLHHIEKIYNIYPEAQFLHIVRDGREVVRSYLDLKKNENNSKYAPDLPKTIRTAIKDWVHNLSEINASFKKINSDNIFEFRYEDLVVNPKETLLKICNFLNEPFSKNMIYYNKNNIDKEPQEFDEWKKTLDKGLVKTKIDKWKNKLNNNEVKTIEEIAHDMLIRYKYNLYIER